MATTSLLMSKLIDIGAMHRRRESMDEEIDLSQFEKRREYRRDRNSRMFLQVLTSEDLDLIGTTMSAQAIDSSASGLRFVCAASIPAGCQLDLWIDDDAGPGKFFLSCDVLWVKPTREGHELGVGLHNGAATDIIRWRERHV